VDHGSQPHPIDRVSAPLLLRLVALPRWAQVLFPALLTVGGLFLDGWVGALLLLVLAALLAWLAFLGRHRTPPAGLVLRAAVVGVVLLAAYAKVA
jgi:hypothetical protein